MVKPIRITNSDSIPAQRRGRLEYPISPKRPLNWFERVNNHYLLEDHSTNLLEYVGHRAIALPILAADVALVSIAVVTGASGAACSSENLSTQLTPGRPGATDGQGHLLDAGGDAPGDAADPSTVADSNGDGVPDTSVVPDDADSDAQAAADDGVVTLKDADGDGVPDEVDTFIAADDGIADDGVADDGTPIADEETSAADDGVVTLEDVDGDGVPDEVDTFIAADEGIADDGAADDGATDVVTDEGVTTDVPETAPEVDVGPEVTPLQLKCEAPQPEMTCLVGEKNIKVPLLVQGATSVECSTPLTNIPLADPNTPTTVNVVLKDCATTTVTCEAWNDKTSAVDTCETAKVTAIKPNAKPEGSPKGPKGVVYPSGDQSYTPGNTISFSVLATDPDKDAIITGLSVYHDNVKIAGMSATFDFSTYSKGPITFNLAASALVKKAGTYCYDFALDDGKGGVSTTVKECFTANEKGALAVYTFDEMSGVVFGDKTGKGPNGSIFSKNPQKMWAINPVTGAKMLCLNGIDDHASITIPDAWKEMGNLTVRTSLSIAPDNNPDTFLLHWSSEVKHGLMLRFQGGIPKTIFGLCGDSKTAPCENTYWWWATTESPLVPKQVYDVTGTITMGSASLYINGAKVGEKAAEQSVKALLGNTMTIGTLLGATPPNYYFKGCIDKLVLLEGVAP